MQLLFHGDSYMRYAIIEMGVVTNLILADLEFASTIGAVPCPNEVNIGWNYDGITFFAPLTLAPSKEQIIDAVQMRMDTFAQTRDYDDIKSASTYAGCSIPKFDIEGTYCRNIRAQTWYVLYDILTEIDNGQRAMPTSFSDIEPLLPVLQWPN